jgi:hypothetical protein
MCLSALGLSFFALSSEYKRYLLDEFFYLVKEGFSYSDIQIMPTYQRKYFIGKILERIDIQKEKNENWSR